MYLDVLVGMVMHKGFRYCVVSRHRLKVNPICLPIWPLASVVTKGVTVGAAKPTDPVRVVPLSIQIFSIGSKAFRALSSYRRGAIPLTWCSLATTGKEA